MKEDLGRGQEYWYYNLPTFPADDAKRGTFVEGVGVGITNGHLAYWGCSYVSSGDPVTGQKQLVLTGNREHGDSPTLELFLVRSNQTGDDRFIDTQLFPKLGFIPKTPLLSVRRLKRVTLEERVPADGAGRMNWDFNVSLTTEDAMQLKEMTQTNISRRTLIMVGNEPVSAPSIVAPLETGRFVIRCEDRGLMESVMRNFEKMERQGP